MKKTKKYFGIFLFLFISLKLFSQQLTLDLTQPEQQEDFLKYLKTTISLLEDSSMKNNMKGYGLKNLSDSNKMQIAYKMMKDTIYFKRLYDYFAFMKILEDKYHLSKFSHEDWVEVAQFGARNGIYFISSMNKFKEKKGTLPIIPDNFLILPLKNSKDTTHSPDFRQK